MNNLNWLETHWVAWYLWFNNPVLATGVASLLLHEVVYFGRCIPWVIIDAMPYFRKWKLQPNKVPTALEQWECTKQVLYSHLLVELPVIWLFHSVAEAFGMSTWQVPFPAWKAQLLQVALFFVFEDMFHYFAHHALHWGPLYKNIHKIHHKYSAPFGLAAEFAHPAEVMILGTGTISGPLLYCAFRRDLHIVTVYIWIVLRLSTRIVATHLLPFWSGAEHHDFHHKAFVNNFSTSFRWCDCIFGTDTKYREYSKRVEAMKKLGLSQKEYQERERQILMEAEQEGLRAEAEVESYSLTGKKRD